jgi:hypothetical protein
MYRLTPSDGKRDHAGSADGRTGGCARAAGPDGSVYLGTSVRDGRGSPGAQDDWRAAATIAHA